MDVAGARRRPSETGNSCCSFHIPYVQQVIRIFGIRYTSAKAVVAPHSWLATSTDARCFYCKAWATRPSLRDSSKIRAATAFSVSSREEPVSMMCCARLRFSASGTCRPRMERNLSSVIPGLARTRSLCASSPADTTATASTFDSIFVSNSNGTSRTTSMLPSRRLCCRKAIRFCSSSGCTASSSRFMASSFPMTYLLSSLRSTPPSTIASGNSSRITGTAPPPAPYSSCTTASESMTGTPASLNILDTVLFPMPMEPVSPSTNMLPSLSVDAMQAADRQGLPRAADRPRRVIKGNRLAWCRRGAGSESVRGCSAGTAKLRQATPPEWQWEAVALWRDDRLLGWRAVALSTERTLDSARARKIIRPARRMLEASVG
mmetsp:Transcript_35885/g.101614  ORF Transcript_35885/g.101614 Transcript_35885/m.101614 type:complete len:376 (-) Transcript_35885:64-1191(-)